MKLVFNIEKGHLVFFSLFLVLAGSVFVIATGWDSSKPFHEPLYTNNIEPMSNQYISIPKLRLGGSNDGEFWTLGINGPTILNGDLRVNKDLIVNEDICNTNNRCVSVEEIVNSILEDSGTPENDGPQDDTNEIFAYGTSGSDYSPSWKSYNIINDELIPYWNCNIGNTVNLNLIYEKEFITTELNNKNYINFVSIGANSHENHHLMLNATVEKKVNNVWTMIPINIEGNLWIGDQGNWDRNYGTHRYFGCTLNEECVRSGKIAITDEMKQNNIKVKVIACGNYENIENAKNTVMGYFLKSATSVTLKQA